MKIIDLLVKKANGETLPKKIFVLGEVFEFNVIYKTYLNSSYEYLFSDEYQWEEKINDEVKIIEEQEEPNKIEKLDLYEELDIILDNNDYKPIKHTLHKALKETEIKLNEVIDKLNEMEKEYERKCRKEI